MYEAFEGFLQVPTWHTDHIADRKRFFQALHGVVRQHDFNADDMAEYMRQKFSSANDHFIAAISSYRDAAWAVREYLEATGAL